MSVEENKALVRRWFEEVWNRGNAAAIDALAAAGFVLHHPARPGQPTDLSTYKQLYPVYRIALPDLYITVDDMVAEGDKVAVRITHTATHLGEYRGVAPTGKRLTWTAQVIVRVRDGMLAEAWAEEDWHGLQQQLGAVPGPTAAAG